jgi:hypothetical protein
MTRCTVDADTQLSFVPTPFTITHLNGVTVMTVEVDSVVVTNGRVVLTRTENDPGPDYELRVTDRVTVRY